MEKKTERRKVSLAGLRLVGAGAVLGLALAAPGAATPRDNTPPKPDAAPTAERS